MYSASLRCVPTTYSISLRCMPMSASSRSLKRHIVSCNLSCSRISSAHAVPAVLGDKPASSRRASTSDRSRRGTWPLPSSNGRRDCFRRPATVGGHARHRRRGHPRAAAREPPDKPSQPRQASCSVRTAHAQKRWPCFGQPGPWLVATTGSSHANCYQRGRLGAVQRFSGSSHPHPGFQARCCWRADDGRAAFARFRRDLANPWLFLC